MGLLGHFVSLLVLIVFTAGLEGAEVRRPNILFILTDDLGYMDIQANNPKTFHETPNIDRLARQGMRFTRGYERLSGVLFHHGTISCLKPGGTTFMPSCRNRPGRAHQGRL